MKKLLSLILALTIIFTFAACGKTPAVKEEDKSSENTAPAAADNADRKDEDGDSAEAVPAEFVDPWVKHDTDSLIWEYKDWTLTISGSGPMRDYDIDFPEWYDYAPVAAKIIVGEGITTIGQFAFADFMEVTEISLPSTLEAVGESAFDNCWALWTLNLPESVTYIGARAFYNNIIHEPKDFALPEGLEYLGNEAFHAALIETDVVIPASLKYMGSQPFTNSHVLSFTVDKDNPSYTAQNGVLFDKKMETIIQFPYDSTKTDYVIPDSVKQIEPECFNVTDDLCTVTIGPNVELIAEGSFFYNYALTDILVDEANKNFKSVDGVLYSADGKNLIAFPTAKEADGYIVPEGCERICAWNFPNRDDITVFNMPDTLKSVGDFAFWNDMYLTSVYFPACIESIEPYAFNYCYGIENVYYEGTEEQWKALNIDSETNDGLFYGTVHYETARN